MNYKKCTILACIMLLAACGPDDDKPADSNSSMLEPWQNDILLPVKLTPGEASTRAADGLMNGNLPSGTDITVVIDGQGKFHSSQIGTEYPKFLAYYIIIHTFAPEIFAFRIMRILIINGSPRKKGLISQMLDMMRAEAEQRGDRVETVITNQLNVKPCCGCMCCRSKWKCVMSTDDSQQVLQQLEQADAVIMGAPCYWGNIPGQMKLLFDRMVYGMMRDTPRFPQPLMKGKKCILLSTCTTPWPWNIWFNQSHGAIRAMREIARYAGFDIVATIERGGTAMHPTLTDSDINKCSKAINKLR